MENKISLITICSNSLPYLKQTLPQNIRDNDDYENLEFLVLDYGSSDGLESWIAAHMGDQLSSGKLKYFRILEERIYHPSHSRNLAFSLASGDILCNIDTALYTGHSFARYVDDIFSADENIVITPIDYFGIKQSYYVSADLFGLCCVRNIDFHKIAGFDESMNNYGFEDVDFINRLEMTGVRRYIPEDVSRFNYISHGKDEKFSVEEAQKKISRVLVAYPEQAKSEWVIVYKDGSYERFLLVDKYALESCFFVNAYTANINRYQLYQENVEYGNGEWQGADLNYFEVMNKLTITKLLDFKFTFHSRSIMEQNVKNRRIVPNGHCYGQGKVRSLTTKIIS